MNNRPFTTYLASPNNQLQADAARGMNVLLSCAIYAPWMDGYQGSFSGILIDSGAYSEMNSGKVVDIEHYVDFTARWTDRADAIAGLDDIRGDWRRSLRNYERGGFPTYHDSDPFELLPDLIDISRERGNWLGIGLVPPRTGKLGWLVSTLARIPPDIHVHGWALRLYRDQGRLDSVDSTNWWRDAMKLRTLPDTKHLTYGECLGVIVKRYQRERRTIASTKDATQGDLWTS